MCLSQKSSVLNNVRTVKGKPLDFCHVSPDVFGVTLAFSVFLNVGRLEARCKCLKRPLTTATFNFKNYSPNCQSMT